MQSLIIIRYNSNMTQSQGKKVFLLYPHSVIANELIDAIREAEYEVYLIEDHVKMKELLVKHKDSILFLNIDKEIDNLDWVKYSSRIMEDEETKSTNIGVMSYNEDKELAEKYLMGLMVNCGFIQLKLGLESSKQIILKTLEANEARGKRHYVRAVCGISDNIGFNVMINDKMHSGKILDISIVGMAVIFDNPLEISLKSLIKDIQLKLKGIICRVSGVIYATRRGDEGGYVLLFGKSITSDVKKKIHNFVHSQLHEQIMK